MERETVIRVEGLEKRFGARRALRGVDWTVRRGEVWTVFGPNGAGKTTLMRILATLTRPTAGQVWVGGCALREDPQGVRRQIGLVTHQTLLYGDLTARENLLFFGRLYGVPGLETRIEELMDWVGLLARLHDPVRTYSRGMQQRLAIARALLHRPPILLLDEPYTGLDPEAADRLTELIRQLREAGHTVVLTSHNLDQGLALADRVGVLARGRFVEQAEGEDWRHGDPYRRYRELLGRA